MPNLFDYSLFRCYCETSASNTYTVMNRTSNNTDSSVSQAGLAALNLIMNRESLLPSSCTCTRPFDVSRLHFYVFCAYRQTNTEGDSSSPAHAVEALSPGWPCLRHRPCRRSRKRSLPTQKLESWRSRCRGRRVDTRPGMPWPH